MIPVASHGRRGGSIAVYGNDSLRKVIGVTETDRLGRDSGGSGPEYQHQNKQKGEGFAGILENERKKNEEPRDISVNSTGYGANGLPQTIYIRMKDYTYQK
ncbi:MAG: hypothetical protein K6G12_04510 [Lachnospiraceae bacterium]|nr:hypothetical protein [Lachnospiraceae bacterium]